MKNKQLVFSIIIVLFLNVTLAKNQSSVQKIVEKYCNLELSGDSAIDRSTLIKFSKEREEFENRKDSEFGGKMIYWKADSIFVVKKFKVGKIISKNGFATCLVVYERLAKTEGYGDADRKIVPSYMKNDSIVLRLVFENNRWWIFDPPPPKISLMTLLKIYIGDSKRLNNTFGDGKDLCGPQKKYYENIQNTLEVLKKLAR
jgi:hypothetical protein